MKYCKEIIKMEDIEVVLDTEAALKKIVQGDGVDVKNIRPRVI